MWLTQKWFSCCQYSCLWSQPNNHILLPKKKKKRKETFIVWHQCFAISLSEFQSSYFNFQSDSSLIFNSYLFNTVSWTVFTSLTETSSLCILLQIYLCHLLFPLFFHWCGCISFVQLLSLLSRQFSKIKPNVLYVEVCPFFTLKVFQKIPQCPLILLVLSWYCQINFDWISPKYFRPRL